MKYLNLLITISLLTLSLGCSDNDNNSSSIITPNPAADFKPKVGDELSTDEKQAFIQFAKDREIGQIDEYIFKPTEAGEEQDDINKKEDSLSDSQKNQIKNIFDTCQLELPNIKSEEPDENTIIDTETSSIKPKDDNLCPINFESLVKNTQNSIISKASGILSIKIAEDASSSLQVPGKDMIAEFGIKSVTRNMKSASDVSVQVNVASGQPVSANGQITGNQTEEYVLQDDSLSQLKIEMGAIFSIQYENQQPTYSGSIVQHAEVKFKGKKAIFSHQQILEANEVKSDKLYLNGEEVSLEGMGFKHYLN